MWSSLQWRPERGPCSQYPISTYTCGETITLRVCGGVLFELKLFEKVNNNKNHKKNCSLKKKKKKKKRRVSFKLRDKDWVQFSVALDLFGWCHMFTVKHVII